MSAQYSARVTEYIHQAHDALPEDLYLEGMVSSEFLPESRHALPTKEHDAYQRNNYLQQRHLRAEAEAAALRAMISPTRRRGAQRGPILVPTLNIEKLKLPTAIPVSKALDVVQECAPMVTTGLASLAAHTDTIAINLSACDPIANHPPEVSVKPPGTTPPITQKRKSSIAPLNCEQIARSLKTGKKVKDCFVEYLAENEGQRVFGRSIFYALVRQSTAEAAHIATLVRSPAPSPSS